MYRKCYNKCCKNGALLEAMPKMENCVSTAPVRTNQGSSPPENHTKNKTNSTCEPPRSGYCFLSKKSQKILEKCPHLAFLLEILMAKLMVQKVDRKWTGSGPDRPDSERIPTRFRWYFTRISCAWPYYCSFCPHAGSLSSNTQFVDCSYPFICSISSVRSHLLSAYLMPWRSLDAPCWQPSAPKLKSQKEASSGLSSVKSQKEASSHQHQE